MFSRYVCTVLQGICDEVTTTQVLGVVAFLVNAYAKSANIFGNPSRLPGIKRQSTFCKTLFQQFS